MRGDQVIVALIVVGAIGYLVRQALQSRTAAKDHTCDRCGH